MAGFAVEVVATTTRRFITASLLALALAAAAATAAPASGPRAIEDKDKIVLANDHVTVWFHGKKPMLKVFPTGNESAAFGYKLHEVVEFRDLDGNGAPGPREVVARLSLERASAFDVHATEADGVATINLTLVAPVTLGGPLSGQNVSLPDRTANVSLVFTLRASDASLEAGNVTFAVPASAVKYDLVVAAWPWVDAEAHRLALEVVVTGALADAEADGLAARTVTANGTALGLVAWAESARGWTMDGTEVAVPVVATVEPSAMMPDAESGVDGNATRVTLAYDAPGLARLVHDPTVGVLSAASTVPEAPAILNRLQEVPAAGAALALAALGAVAVAAGRRR